jgi:hypothetical protein
LRLNRLNALLTLFFGVFLAIEGQRSAVPASAGSIWDPSQAG